MLLENIARHEFVYRRKRACIDTVKIGSRYETMVMYESGREIEYAISDTVREAKKAHNCMVMKYNDILYEDSLQKKLGIPNTGQFMTVIRSC